jgi:CRP-like cAMP-binding protein
MVSNRILTALPAGERAAIEARLERYEHRVRDPVYRQGERIESVVFPVSGVFSLVAETDHAQVEVATVGREGFVGLPVFLQATLTGAHMAFSQIEGEALRMDAADFLDVVNAAPALRAALQRYAMALMTQIARGTACNRLHTIEQRAARWLLQTHDRVDGDRFGLRREFLAQMLGDDRDAVALATDALASAGLIAYENEHVSVSDRAGLERTSCDCYQVVRSEYDRLLSG